jgi:cellobiose phosphorylase
MEISNSKGLKIKVLPNGSIGSIAVDRLRINLRESDIHSASGTLLFARIHGHDLQLEPLLGPSLKGSFGIADNKFYAKGESEYLRYLAELKTSPNETAWMWSLMITNTGTNPIQIDAICIQDLGLRHGESLVNEYYVSQYTERRLFDSASYGKVAVCRQNMRQSTGNPWLLMVCPEGAVAAATDGAQIYGPKNRHSAFPPGLYLPQLGGEYAGESSLLALQSKMITLNPGAGIVLRFMFFFVADHSGPSAASDLDIIRSVLGSFEAFNPLPYLPCKQRPVKSFFNPPKFFLSEDLNENELLSFFGTTRNHAEYHNNSLLSFFTDDGNHIVLKDKELIVDRPHAHIIRSGNSLLPDERIMSTNPFMNGVFNAHTSSGNTNFNVLHSVYSNQFGLASPAGQRVFIKINNVYHLLGVPSAFEMGFNYCRWIYKYNEVVLEAATWTSTNNHQINFRFNVLDGKPVDLMITNHFDEGSQFSVKFLDNFSATIKPSKQSLMGKQFPGAVFAAFLVAYDGLVEVDVDRLVEANSKILVYSFTDCTEVQFSFACFYAGETIEASPADFSTDALSAHFGWKQCAQGIHLRGAQRDIHAINTILPWFGNNALTHYLTPYGLEQFGGAAWGTRDVSQGPIEMLLSLGRHHEAKQILRTIFSNQHPDGGWSQWWMFDSYAHIRAHEAHGDITYWVMIALSKYLEQTADYEFLAEALPWFNPISHAIEASSPLVGHIERWLEMITSSFITGTALVPFGGGDWNDSLQPASSLLAARLISAWTVQMSFQAFRTLAKVLKSGQYDALAARLFDLSNQVHNDFHKYLVKDGVVAGYGKLEDDGKISLLLHPTDSETGISYSILPMNRGVLSQIFEPDQADIHMKLINKHLKGPDGARLMDKPIQYTGGMMRIFQRAETSTYFGREIGLMYVHEHIRHAEALAILGRADEFVRTLRQAMPVDYQNIVPNAAPRQSNCYYSSSDIIFSNRYEADEKYHLLHSGSLTFRGGWRIYSSGPGIFVALIITRLLGIRYRNKHLLIDPVMPFSFDGLEVDYQILGKPVLIKYTVKNGNHSPKKIVLNGRALTYATERQSFRNGGAVLAIEGLKTILNDRSNILEIIL